MLMNWFFDEPFPMKRVAGAVGLALAWKGIGPGARTDRICT